MKWTNLTRFAAGVFRTELTPDEMLASVLVRARFRLVCANRLELVDADAQLEDLRRDLLETPYGALEPDLPHPRTGTDVIVFADARPSDTDPGIGAVELRAGAYHLRLAVFGERRWVNRYGDLIPSDPAPFVVMPITWSNAYGGRAKHPDPPVEVPFPNNPEGKGYCLDVDAALDLPLPNIEDPDSLISRWTDQPQPAGWGPYPRSWGLAVELMCETWQDADGRWAYNLRPEHLFDRAHPRLCGQQLCPGQRVEITGTSHAPRVTFALPQVPAILDIRIGDSELSRGFGIEEVLIDLIEGQVDIAYRKILRYDFVAHQQRELTLRAQREDEAP